jgi:ComF family protein
VSEHGQLCADCWNKFDWIGAPLCARCGYPFPAGIDNDGGMLCPDCIGKKTRLDWMRSACVYDETSRGVTLPFKHGGRLEYRDLMARSMIAALRGLDGKDVVVLPVPLAALRLWKRGYNQAALLARPLAKRLGAKVDYDSVTRIHRADMGHKNAAQRKRNVAGVFRVRRPGKIRGRAILLVDDVFTTGATFGELARVLRKSGATWVGGATFCRVVRAI